MATGLVGGSAALCFLTRKQSATEDRMSIFKKMYDLHVFESEYAGEVCFASSAEKSS
jgi:hypothetical protein